MMVLDYSVVLMFALVAIAIALLVGAYFLPALLAGDRQDTQSIRRLNFWLGWTGIGWIIALIWAIRSPKKQPGRLVDRHSSAESPHPTAITPFVYPRYELREELQLVGKHFHIYNPAGEEVLIVKMKPFRLREDIRMYLAPDFQREALVVKARQILDVSATYDVVDAVEQQAVGAIKRQGFRSLLRDEWLISDRAGRLLVTMKEDRLLFALLRRLVVNFFPQQFTGSAHGRAICNFKQSWNPFVMNMSVDFSEDINDILDRRLGIAAAVLLCAVEGKQQ